MSDSLASVARRQDPDITLLFRTLASAIGNAAVNLSGD
jgi:hypothetical protein